MKRILKRTMTIGKLCMYEPDIDTWLRLEDPNFIVNFSIDMPICFQLYRDDEIVSISKEHLIDTINRRTGEFKIEDKETNMEILRQTICGDVYISTCYRVDEVDV